MALDDKPLDQLDAADLADLVENSVAEGTVLDYKTELPTNQDEDRREFLRDASSFANTLGGHIVYGIAEDGGIPQGVTGVEIANPEAERLRLENMLRDGIAPRLPRVEIQPVPLEGGRAALVLRIGRSVLRPHMVTFRGLSQFWARNSAGKYRLDVDQIRAAMRAGPQAAEQVRNFRRERVGNVLSGDVPYPLAESPKIILHLVPLDAFDESQALIDLRSVQDDNRLRPLYRDQPETIRWNLDGLYADDRWNAPQAEASVQLFRNGIVEAVEGRMIRLAATFANEQQVLQGYPFERTVVDGVQRYVSLQRDIGVGLPVAVLLTLTGVGGYRIQTADQRAEALRDEVHRFDRNLIPLPEALFDGWEDDVPSTLRPTFDAFWQAGGFHGSPNYDADGAWQRWE